MHVKRVATVAEEEHFMKTVNVRAVSMYVRL